VDQDVDRADEFGAEDHDQQVEQADLADPLPAVARSGRDDRAGSGGSEQDADHAEHRRRVADVGLRDQAEERDRQRVVEREQRRGRPYLLDHVLMGGPDPVRGDRQRDEKQAGQCARAPRDRYEKVSVRPIYHGANDTGGIYSPLADQSFLDLPAGRK
jgi:hypothetical protein